MLVSTITNLSDYIVCYLFVAIDFYVIKLDF